MNDLTLILIGLILLVNTSCMELTDKGAITQTPAKKIQSATSSLAVKVEVATIFNDTLGWGYEILINHERVIRQTHIPAINGIKGFRTKSDAERVGNLVVDKIRKNNNPPSVSIAELDSLSIYY